MQENPFGKIEEEVSKKVTGVNYRGNESVSFENYNQTGSIQIDATAPSVSTPSIILSINPQTKNLVAYADTGSGYQWVGSVSLQ